MIARLFPTAALALLLAPAAMAAAPESPRTPEGTESARHEARSRDRGASKSRRTAKKGPAAPNGGPSARPASGRPASADRQPTSGQRPSGGGSSSSGDRPQDDRPAGGGQGGSPGAPAPGAGSSGEVQRSPQGGHLPPGAAGARPASVAGLGIQGARPAAPPNYRPVSRPPASAGSGHQPAHSPQARQEAARARAYATARSHHEAARGGYRPSNHPAQVHAHARARAHHRAWVERHHRPWYRVPVVVRWHPGYPRYWYHGIFVYGPGPRYAGHAHVPASAAPEREVDRAQTWAVGLRTGSYMSGYRGGAAYGDFGMGVALRYRPVESLGFEGQWVYHDQSWDSATERISQPLSLSVQLFALPWTRFNPYLSAGITHTGLNLQDQVGQQMVDAEGALWGPHLGAGLEFGLGEKASINFDLRGIGYLNAPADAMLRPGAAQANMGVNFYF